MLVTIEYPKWLSCNDSIPAAYRCWFIIYQAGYFVFDEREVPGYPFIEVKWFERGQEIRDEFANIITKQVQSLEIPEVEVAFSTFRESDYYLNGKSFAEE